MLYRYAQTSDIPHIAKIYNIAIAEGGANAFTDQLPLEYFENFFHNHPSDKYPIIVCEADTDIAGFSYISPYRAERKALRITAEISYYVDPKHRGRGIGQALIECITDKCPDLGIITLFAIILEENQASIRLMKRTGFSEWAYLPRTAIFDGRITGQYYYGKNI